MLFTSFLPALVLITSVLSSDTPTKTQATRSISQPISDIDSRSLFNRALAGLTACVTTTADIPVVVTPPQIRVSTGVVGVTALVANTGGVTLPVTVKAGVCLCAVGGVLTDTSVANLGAALNLGATANVANVLNLFGLADLNALARLVAPVLDPLLPTPTGAAASCPYPTQGTFEPVCGTTCQYACTGTTTQRCNGQCIASTATCPTGGIGKLRRSFNPALLCPAGLTACGYAKSSARFVGAFECLDTKSNVDTCGGCEFPLPNQPKGTDCSTIENVSSVSCVSGKCVIETCKRGYTILGLECIKV